MSNKFIYSLLLLCTGGVLASAQGLKSDLRKGNKLYQEHSYAAAEQSYRRALLKDSLYAKTNFALAAAAYEQKHYDQAKNYLSRLAEAKLPELQQADVLHNLGNVAMRQKDYKTAVSTYEEALIRNPQNEHTRYNLALAQRLLKQEQQKQDQNKQQQNQEQQQSQDQKQQQSQQKDKQDPSKQNAQQRQSDKQQGGQPAGPRPGQVSREQAEQLLKAFRSDDEQTRRRVEQRQREQQSQSSNKNKKRW